MKSFISFGNIFISISCVSYVPVTIFTARPPVNAKKHKSEKFVSKIIFTELPDKLDIILKLKLLKISAKQQKKYFEEITQLRNKVAHSSDYADSLKNCIKTSKTVNFILKLLNEISNFKI